jgi:flagellar biosynthesis/type III secretory pathway M-ring protein FliF/YscJ
LNYEVPPPATAWKKIAAALDESELAHEFPSKLYGAEVMPPVTVWNKITSSLDTEKDTNKQEQRRIFPFLKYAAAAVVMGFLAWGGVRLFYNNNNSGNNELVKNEMTGPEKTMATPPTDPVTNSSSEITASTDTNNATEEARNDAALENSKKTFAKLDFPVKSRIRGIASAYSFDSSPAYENNSGVLSNDEIINCELSSRYITLMTQEGNIIRMSKKLNDMACCVSGEEINNECKDQMKKWREKIACSPTCHSSGSFIDILGLVDALQDN